MIARILILLLLLLLLPQCYLDWRRKERSRGWKRLLRWLPTIAMMAWTVLLSLERDFIPVEMSGLNVYLLLLGALFVPKTLYVLCSAVGLLMRKLLRKRQNWGNLVGLLLAVWAFCAFLYGSTVGVRRLEVKRVELAFDNLPEAFDGYRLVLFSDAHVGTFTGSLRVSLQRDIDSINAQRADLIVFAGDLQNLRPSELYPVQDMLRTLSARDGVVSVLGNHDYSAYIHDDPAVMAANERELVSRERQMGWTLLKNEHVVIDRSGSQMVVAGEENGGDKAVTDRDDLRQTLQGVPDGAFTILVQHDPTEWRQTILPDSRVQLTLSGHTHGGQVSVLGLRATRLRYAEDYGLYREGDRVLYVTGGIGGLVPFRLGITPEIIVMTLRKK